MGEFLLNSNNWAQREGKGIEERKEVAQLKAGNSRSWRLRRGEEAQGWWYLEKGGQS